MSVEEAQQRISPIEFLRWKLIAVIDEEDKWRRQDRADFYMARVAYWVYLLKHSVDTMFAKHRPQPKMEFKDFVIDFQKAIDKAKKTKRKPDAATPTEESIDDEWEDTLDLEETEEELQRRKDEANLAAHNRWAGFLGVTLKQVGADKFVKGPDEYESNEYED